MPGADHKGTVRETRILSTLVIAEANRPRKGLPQEVEQTLRHHEEAGTGFKEMNHTLKERAAAVPEGG